MVCRRGLRLDASRTGHRGRPRGAADRRDATALAPRGETDIVWFGRRIPLRLAVLAAVLAAVGGWLAFSSRSLDRSLVYSYTPGDIAAGKTPAGDIRVGGQVTPGSVRWDPERRLLRFVLRDDRGSVRVVQRGAPPALFGAGRGAVVEGVLENGILVSSQLIVRHGSDYSPPPGVKRR